MNLRQTYLVAGILWALLLGPLAALTVFGFAAGVSWLWLFGDSSWPAGTQAALPLIGLAAGVAAAMACVYLGISHGRQREAAGGGENAAERRKALLIAAAPIALAMLAGAKLWWDARSYSQAMAIAAQREVNLMSLASRVQKITSISVEPSAGGTFRARIGLNGKRDGEYRLSWDVKSTSFEQPLANGTRTVRLKTGENREEISFTLDQIADGYRSRLSSAGDVLVDEPFHLHASVEPELSGADLERLPPGERRQLKSGESMLRSQKSVDFHLRFFIRRDVPVTK